MQRYSVPSHSDPSKNHTVIQVNAIFECDCIANQMGKECRHIRIVKKSLGLTYKLFEGECWYCHNRCPLTEHHLWRRSQGGTNKPTVWLCLRCHNLATDNKEFEDKLQNLYAEQNSGKIRNLRASQKS